MKTEAKYCGVLTSPETKVLLNSMREQVPGLTEAQMMHNLILRFAADGRFTETFVADMKIEVEAANEAREQLRKEKYGELLANGRALRAAAKATRPAKASKISKAPKAPKAVKPGKVARVKKNAPATSEPIDATPQAEWSFSAEE